MKKVRGKTGNLFWYPRKVAVFQSLFSSLKKMLNTEKCQILRDQFQQSNGKEKLKDIYDGKIWKEFQSVNGKPFLSEEDNYALMLNVD